MEQKNIDITPNNHIHHRRLDLVLLFDQAYRRMGGRGDKLILSVLTMN